MMCNGVLFLNQNCLSAKHLFIHEHYVLLNVFATLVVLEFLKFINGDGKYVLK